MTARTYLFSGTDGWTCTNATCSNLSGTYFHVLPTTSDPQTRSPTAIAFDPSATDYIRIAIRSSSSNNVLQIYYQNGSHSFSESFTKTFPINIDNTLHYFTIPLSGSNPGPDLGGIPGWTSSQVQQLRIDPARASGGAIDYDFVVMRRDGDDPYAPAITVGPPGWTNGPITVTVVGDDPPPVGFSGTGNPDKYGSGVFDFGWRIDGGPETWTQYNNGYDIIEGHAYLTLSFPPGSLSSGAHAISIRSRDRCGRIGTSSVATLLYDAMPPGTPVITSVTPFDWTNQNSFTITWDDPGDFGSGIDHFEYSVNDGGVVVPTGTSATVNAPIPGENTFKVRAIDQLGNVGAWSDYAYFYLDNVNPNPPANLQISPAGYTNVNDFTAVWEDGGDQHSGVVAFEVLVNGQSFGTVTELGISGGLAATQGANTLEVRAIDYVGNVSSLSAPDTFYYSTSYILPPVAFDPANAESVALPRTFGWNPGSGTSGYEIQISLDSGFTTGTWSATSDLATTPVPTVAAPVIGQAYYWRVRPLGSVPAENWSATQLFYTVSPPPPPIEQVIGSEFPSGEAGDGVNTSLGAVTRAFRILTLHGPGGDVDLTASYSSIGSRTGTLGPKWTWTLGQQLSVVPNVGAEATLEDGQTIHFEWKGSGFSPDLGVYDSLNVSGSDYELVRPSRHHIAFDAAGLLQSIRDRNGNAISLTYSGNSPTQFTDAAGRVFTITTSGGRVTQIQDILGRTWQFGYDTDGYLARFTDAMSHQTQFEYDTQGRLTREVDARGNNALRCTYSSDGRVATQIDAIGGTTTFAYDDTALQTTVTNPLFGTLTHIRDSSSRLVSEVNERGDATVYTYDAQHNRLAVRDPRGNEMRYEYDTRGNIVRITDPLGAITRTAYDMNNSPTERTDARGHITTYTNDSKGNPIRIDEPSSPGTTTPYRVTRFVYNPAGQPTLITDPNTHDTSNEYDTQGNLVETTNGAGDVVTFGFDEIGRNTRMTDGLLKTTTYAYDANDSLLSRTNALPATEAYEYDANGNRTVLTDERGKRTEYTYDEKDRLIRVIAPLEKKTEYVYDALDHRIMTTDPRGNARQTGYDAVGNVITEVDALSHQTTHTYDGNHNRLSTTNPRGKTTTFAYDAMNQLLSTTDPLGHAVSNTYDLLGHVIGATNARGNMTTFNYDYQGRLASVQAPNGGLTVYGYDPVGNRTVIKNALGHSTTMTYDGANRLLTTTNPLQQQETNAYDAAGNRTQRFRSGLTNYGYDAANRLIATTYFDGTYIERGYDLGNNLVSLTSGQSFQQFAMLTYGYDDSGRLTSATDRISHPIVYRPDKTLGVVYDSTDNRVALTYPDGQAAHYVYDAENRLISTLDWLNRSVVYSYDATDNLVGITHPNGVSTVLTYDDADRLIAILTTSSAQETLVAFAYTLDQNGNRTRIQRVDRRDDPQRLDSPDVYSTSALLSQSAFPAGADSIVVVSGEDWSEAVGGPALARRRGSPLLVLPGDNLWRSAAVRTELQRLKNARPDASVIIMGDVGGVSAIVETQLEAMGFGVRRVMGANRVGTAVAAAQSTPKAVLLGTTDFSLAGAAALMAARRGVPILFARTDSVPQATRDALGTLGVGNTVLTGTLGPGVAMWLNGNGHAVEAQFYETEPAALCAATLEAEDPPVGGYERLRVVSRDAYEDALSVSAAPDSATTATLLADPNGLGSTPAVAHWIAENKGRLKSTTLIGSTVALSAALEADVRSALRTTVTDYAYNTLDELVSENVREGESTSYTYDEMGNRTSTTHNGTLTTYVYNGADRLTSAGGTSYTYDGNGNRSTKTVGAITTSYVYDGENRLASINGPSGSSFYFYDGLGRRIGAVEHGRIAGYVVDPTARPYATLQELDGNQDLRASFVHAAGLVSEIAPDGSARFFHYDGLGSTSAITDSTGSDVGHLGFAAFGRTVLDLGSTDTRFGYVGRYGVEATPSGLQFMRDRFYDPEIGMFLSEDPDVGGEREFLREALYSYASGNPLLLIDPDGNAARAPSRQKTKTVIKITNAALSIAAKSVAPAARQPSAATAPVVRRLGTVASILPRAVVRTLDAPSQIGQNWLKLAVSFPSSPGFANTAHYLNEKVSSMPPGSSNPDGPSKGSFVKAGIKFAEFWSRHSPRFEQLPKNASLYNMIYH